VSADDKLQEYRDKRDFRESPEPSGKGKGGGKEPIFVIQKHDASRLHYDFRLEVDGVLKSWAVPKGPSVDPRQRRLAVPTEDHPMEYADFEGVIPEGSYGAGTVLVWDTGTYRNLREEKGGGGGRGGKGGEGGEPTSMQEALDRGKAEVWLEGKKIRGGYALIRTGGGGDSRWLLIKMRDEQADARRNPVSTEPDSVLTGRSLEEIADRHRRG
jgi:DNA ligase D-like protein (predicted 3'-phosphoesterase)